VPAARTCIVSDVGDPGYPGRVAENERLRAAREGLPSTRRPGRYASREELAERVARWISEHDERGREHPFDANHLGKLERGTVRRPGVLIRSALCAVLDATEADLGFTAEAADARLDTIGAGLARPDDAAVDAVAAVLARLRRLEDVTSAAEVVSAVRSQLAVATRLAENACGTMWDRAVGLLSELEQYLGWLAIPLQRWGESRTHLDRTAMVAMEVGDPMRLSMALSFAAYRNMLRRDVNSALALSRAAERENVDQGHRTYLAFQRAELLAYDNQRTDAVNALLEADGDLDRLSASDGQPDDAGYWYTPAVLLGNRGLVRDAMGEHTAARGAAWDALATMPAEWATAEWSTQQRALATGGTTPTAGRVLSPVADG